MTLHSLGPDAGLYYEYAPPQDSAGYTFAFFNALTGDTTHWNASIVPALRAAGHGALVYNMRGQPDSPFSPATSLDEGLIVSDAVSLLGNVQPVRPILVGLSIGGLFAVRAWLAGAPAEGLALINTLRQDGPRLRWVAPEPGHIFKRGGPCGDGEENQDGQGQVEFHGHPLSRPDPNLRIRRGQEKGEPSHRLDCALESLNV